jgi:hypothetical protein
MLTGQKMSRELPKSRRSPAHQVVNWAFQISEVPVLKKRLKKIELSFKHEKGLALDPSRF